VHLLCSSAQRGRPWRMRHRYVCCSVLQCVAVCVLQCAAKSTSFVQVPQEVDLGECAIGMCVAVCCSLLQCVCCSVCGSVLGVCWCVCGSVLQCVAECVLQCVEVCCSVLQCVAECCSVLQFVKVCCSVCGSVLECVGSVCWCVLLQGASPLFKCPKR